MVSLQFFFHIYKFHALLYGLKFILELNFTELKFY
jgi:hypothetical protein